MQPDECILSQDLRNKVIALHKAKAHSKLELSELFSIGYAAIKRWCQEYTLAGKSIVTKQVREDVVEDYSIRLQSRWQGAA